MQTETESPRHVGSSAWFGEIHAQLVARAEGWRNASSDPYNIAYAVHVALLEVANSINAASHLLQSPGCQANAGLSVADSVERANSRRDGQFTERPN